MGRKIKLKQQKEEEALKQYNISLKEHLIKMPFLPEKLIHFDDKTISFFETNKDLWVRDPHAWVCDLKSKDPQKRLLTLLNYTFKKYSVPKFLEQQVINTYYPSKTRSDPRLIAARVQIPSLNPINDKWYLAATSGKSLHKECASHWFSRAETGHLLTFPGNNPDEAVIYACARVFGDRAFALKMAKTNLAQSPEWVNHFFQANWPKFCREIINFFWRYPIENSKINDLLDYFKHARNENKNFSLKGRSLHACKVKMEEWHRALTKAAQITGGSWKGFNLDDQVWTAGEGTKRTKWYLTQITTGDALYKEGQKMRHCVASYKSQCMSGRVSIWSLTYEFPIGNMHKGVTIELNSDGHIRQVKGFANRAAHPEERATVKNWASTNNLFYKPLGDM